MGLGIEIQAPASSRDSTSERSSALEERLRASNRRTQTAARRAQTTAPDSSAPFPEIYDRQGRPSQLNPESELSPGERAPQFSPGERAPQLGSGDRAPQLSPGERAPREAFDIDSTDRPFGVNPHSMSANDLAAATRLSATETRLIQAAVTLAAETRAKPPSPAPRSAPVAAAAVALTVPNAQGDPNSSSAAASDPSQTTPTSSLNRGSDKAPEVGLKVPVSIPSAASPQDLMRIANALRQRLLRSPEPTLRDREMAGLASKVEAQARAMAKAESEQRMALLKEGLERPELIPRVARPEMEHILRYLDDLNRSRADALSYYAKEKMRDLVLDVQAEATDIRMLDTINYDLINGVFLGDLAEDSFAQQIVELRAPYPGETVFVE